MTNEHESVMERSAAQPDLLELRNVEVVYNRAAVALTGVSIKLKRGEIVAVLGPNGAGKTTLLRAISGFVAGDIAEISGGEVLFSGRRINRLSPDRISALGIAVVPEREKLFASLSVADNLKVVSAWSRRRPGFDRWQRVVHELFPVLTDRHRQLAGYLSGGERQMVSMACAMLACPDLLLVDELSLGLAPVVVGELSRAVELANREMGLTILVVEQNATVALKLARYAYVLEQGRISAEGTSASLSGRDDFRRLYLGLAEVGEGRSHYREAWLERHRVSGTR
jgi:branched-chain amino acid transport system ATP-binding protein